MMERRHIIQRRAARSERTRQDRYALYDWVRLFVPQYLGKALVAWWLFTFAACGADPESSSAKMTPAVGFGTAGSYVPPTSSAPVPSANAGTASSVVPVRPTESVGTGAASKPATPGDSPVSPPAAPDAPTTASTSILPCAVSKSVATNCQGCHAAKPIGGAPMSLMTFEDFHKPAVTKPTMKVYELAKLRIHDEMRLMPPTTKMSAADTATLDAWFDAGAVSGATEDTNCVVEPPPSTTMAGAREDEFTYGPLTPLPGETCYEFKTHASTTSVDDKPFNVPVGEQYEQFYFKAPWPDGTLGVGYATISDKAEVLHHWLLFSTLELNAEGDHFTAPLPTLAGVNPVLLAGWAVGAPNQVPPSDVGMELPPTGSTLNVQWHFYNSTGRPQTDASKVQICTVPKGTRPHMGSISWLGTEDLNGNVWFGGPGMPAHKESTFTTTCVPARTGMNSTDPIHIMVFEPHMHRIGKRMKTVANKLDGTTAVLMDEPFSFGNETHYPVSYDLMPGETLTTSCTFNNNTNGGVPFGESTNAEMCYQFTFAWPAHALVNFAPSLLGVTDSCW